MLNPRHILWLVAPATAIILAGCVAVPVGPNGPYAYSAIWALTPPPSGGDGGVPSKAVPPELPQMAIILQARL